MSFWQKNKQYDTIMVATSYVSPAPSDIPLPHEKSRALFKKLHSRLFQSRQFPVNDGYAIVKGMELVKSVLLRYGYTAIDGKLVSRRRDIWPDIELVGRSLGVYAVMPPYSISEEKSALVAPGKPDIPLVRGQSVELDLNRLVPEAQNSNAHWRYAHHHQVLLCQEVRLRK